MLVTILVLGLVMTAILGLLDSSAKVVPKDAERANAIGEAQTGVNGMVRELRQAYRIVGTGENWVQMRVNLLRDDSSTGGPDYANLTVDYSCATGACVRREAPVGASLPATGRTVIGRVLNGAPGLPTSRSVFNFDQTADRSNAAVPGTLDPTFVTVRVEVPAYGERGERGGYDHKVVIDDGFYVRNVGLSR